jgi:hypothetical protein
MAEGAMRSLGQKSFYSIQDQLHWLKLVEYIHLYDEFEGIVLPSIGEALDILVAKHLPDQVLRLVTQLTCRPCLSRQMQRSYHRFVSLASDRGYTLLIM